MVDVAHGGEHRAVDPELVRQRMADWHAFTHFTKIAVAGVIALLILLALITL
ncbi:hypothetical protein M2352_002331 [Azospirillum fermentarium]|uniref:hypothetical protein n=1 Tax=Azospirillum fermentarium TaxID=1233114 RepID=UPI0022275A1E|nr:hypothetical protein [Azospirillum fermentarium]MCW2246740.1 hypothetical protein [Azospirillum fermentarium]